MALPLSASKSQTNDNTPDLKQEFKQLDALLIHYAQLADLASYERMLGDVQKLKHATASAASKGNDVELLRAALMQEVYDLAWAIYDYPAQA